MVCQAYHSYRELEFKRFNSDYFKNQGEVEKYFENHTENHLVEFSKAYPNHDFAFVEVDCFGGKCNSNGYIIKAGGKIFENESYHSGHMDLLARLDDTCESWFFYPFSRTFFQDKGGVNGEMLNIGFGALWMIINIDYGKNPEFGIQFAENEMMLTKIGQYDLYFMKVDDVRIKIMGTFSVMSEHNVNEMKELIQDCFVDLEYYFSLDNFETGERVVLQTMDDQLAQRLAATSYRANSFNNRPFIFSDKKGESGKQTSADTRQQNVKPNANADLEKDGVQNDSDDEKKSGIFGFFNNIFRRN